MKISVKSLLVSCLFATAGFAAQSASAATYDITALLQAQSFAEIAGKYTGTGTTFNDSYTFTIGATQLDAGFYANQGSVVGLDITKFDLLNVTTNTVVALGTATTAGSYSIAKTLLAQGNYALEISGKVTGSVLGNYNGTLNVTAVPEPETYGMMLGGLALVGAVARRKAKKAA